MIQCEKNFDWADTKRKLVIFSLNYKRANLIETVMKHFKTRVPHSEWIHIIGNDGVKESFDEYYDDNVRYFTLYGDGKERNGSFLRNFFIKRCQSELILQKDAEVVLLGDIIENIFEFGKPWRPGWIYPLSQSMTAFYLKYQGLDVNGCQPVGNVAGSNMHSYPNKMIYFDNYSWQSARNSIIKAAGGFCISCYYHYAYCIETTILQSIRGYDERYITYGFEDSDMFCRLAAIGKCITPDYNCRAIHLFHTKKYTSAGITKMQQIWLNSSPDDSIRNPDKWGEG